MIQKFFKDSGHGPHELRAMLEYPMFKRSLESLKAHAREEPLVVRPGAARSEASSKTKLEGNEKSSDAVASVEKDVSTMST